MPKTILNDQSDVHQKIEQVENLMRDLGVRVCGAHLTIQVGNSRVYNIGRDQSVFPREIDEPFWREK